jgi:hypothetical protein
MPASSADDDSRLYLPDPKLGFALIAATETIIDAVNLSGVGQASFRVGVDNCRRSKPSQLHKKMGGYR